MGLGKTWHDVANDIRIKEQEDKVRALLRKSVKAYIGKPLSKKKIETFRKRAEKCMKKMYELAFPFKFKVTSRRDDKSDDLIHISVEPYEAISKESK